MAEFLKHRVGVYHREDRHGLEVDTAGAANNTMVCWVMITCRVSCAIAGGALISGSVAGGRLGESSSIWRRGRGTGDGGFALADNG